MPDYDDEDDDVDDSARPKDTPVIMTHLYLSGGGAKGGSGGSW